MEKLLSALKQIPEYGLLLESIRHKNKQDFEMDLIHIQNNFNRLKGE